MRLVTLRAQGGTRAARLDGDTVTELPFADVGELLRSGGDWATRAKATVGGLERRLHDVALAPVIPSPAKIICLGLNYVSHIVEMGRVLPEHPTLFAKYAVALTGPADPIPLPPESVAVDWEAELAIVIGARVRRVSPEDAGRAIAGYTVANDTSMRDWQNRTLQWLQGKSFEASTPLGPALVTPDELPGDPLAPDLEIRTEVDGEVMQLARTGDLLFGPARSIAYISTFMTLEPGDVILTGTPAGVGAGREPPVYLRPGQVVRVAIEGLGELVNRCEAERLGGSVSGLQGGASGTQP
ncbi:MAG: fumarylacetoacetate hydrolase family protein [Chloroflexi bacterium]|nr:fumarylacetoacetate hydrolase family protein [Chloroflexota bacterium]